MNKKLYTFVIEKKNNSFRFVYLLVHTLSPMTHTRHREPLHDVVWRFLLYFTFFLFFCYFFWKKCARYSPYTVAIVDLCFFPLSLSYRCCCCMFYIFMCGNKHIACLLTCLNENKYTLLLYF